MIYATPNRGRGGAGARGILQGMIAGQQSKANDQKLQLMQTQMDNQRIDRAKEEFNDSMFNMELGGSPDEVNNVMAKYPDLYLDKNPAFTALENDNIPFNSMTNAPFDFMNTDTSQYLTTKFKRLNSKELEDQYGKAYNDDNTINMKHLNKLRELRPDAPITEEMFSDPQRYQEYINNGFVMEEQDKDGKFSNTLMTPEMFEAGSSNYASYKRKRLQDEALTKAKLDNTSKTKDSAYMQVFNKWQNESNPDKKTALKQQLDQLSLDKPTELTSLMDERATLTEESAANGTDHTTRLQNINDRIQKITAWKPAEVASGIKTQQHNIEQTKLLGQDLTQSQSTFDIDSPITEFDEDLDARVRNDKTRWNTKAQALEDEARASQRTLTAGNSLLTQMKSPEFKSGPIDQYTNWLKNVVPSELVGMSVEQIMADASVNQFTAQVLKELSGLAASDSEAARTMLQTVGNPSMNEESRVTTLENYLSNTASNLKKQARQLGDMGLNATAKRLLISQAREGKKKPRAIIVDEGLKGIFPNNPIMEKGGSL